MTEPDEQQINHFAPDAQMGKEYRDLWAAMRWRGLMRGDFLPHESDRFDLMLVWSLPR